MQIYQVMELMHDITFVDKVLATISRSTRPGEPQPTSSAQGSTLPPPGPLLRVVVCRDLADCFKLSQTIFKGEV